MAINASMYSIQWHVLTLPAVYIGTPPQPVYVQLDTGSFELWVNPDCSSLTSTSDKAFCQGIGSYTPSDSSTSHNTDETSSLTYGVGSANITYYVDNIGLSKNGSNAQLDKVRFGVADAGGTQDQFAGVMGLGYGEDADADHGNIVAVMTKQGLIDTKAFSVALGSKDEGGGVLVLGGVDTAKYGGHLARLPIIPADDSPDGVSRYWLAMDSISYTSSDSSTKSSSKTWDDSQMSVFVDTGSTMTLLPTDLANSMAADLGSKGLDSSGFYPVDCSILDTDATIDFAFGNLTIRVPLDEMVRSFNSGASQTCYLGFSPSDEFALLGDSFLRSAYGMSSLIHPPVALIHVLTRTPVIFDLDSSNLYMAQYQNCGTSVSKISKSTNLGSVRGSCGSGSKYVEESGSVTASETASKTRVTATATKTVTATGATADPTATAVSKPASSGGTRSSTALAESASAASDNATSPAARLQTGSWLACAAACFVASVAMF